MTVETRDAKRKMPAERRGELLTAAVGICSTEGLSAVTLRRVASDLGVTPGLVSHYFSSADQLTAEAFRTAAVADLDEARAVVAAAESSAAAMLDLVDYLLDDASATASALWLEAWSIGRRNAALTEATDALTAQWLELIAEVVTTGVAAGEFQVSEPARTARRLLTMIDGLGAQRVVRGVPAGEAKHIARAYVTAELGLTPG